MRTILIHSDVKGADMFRKILASEITDFHIALSIEDYKLEDVEVAIIWLQVPKSLSKLPNLKLILSCGSGVDHIINSPYLPHDVPLVRLVDTFLRDHVSNYVVEHVFKHFLPDLSYHDQGSALFSILEIDKQQKPKIGIMGLGLVGTWTAEKLIGIGFDVCGWVRTSRPRTINEVYVGTKELGEFANKCDILVCQLPLTNETRGILNKHLFDLLPKGAYLINVGRGAHLIESDLLSALESGKLSGACLDVFEVEPLPTNHPFHANTKIKITPHIAGYVSPETQAPYAAQIIASYYKDEMAKGTVDYFSLY
jgi:glyoxylate/hydroxypyruvate reductase A